MPFKCPCWKCPGSYKIPEDALGKQVRCPHCGNIAVIAAPVSRATAGPELSTAVSPAIAPPLPIRPPVIPDLSASALTKRKLTSPLLLGGIGALGLTIVLAVLLWGLNRGGVGKEPITEAPAGADDQGDGDRSAIKDLQPLPPNGQRDPAAQPVVEGNHDADDDETGPPLVLQIHSLDRVFADLKILGEKAKKSKEIEQMFKAVQTPDGKVRLPSIDSNRPWGAYARLKANAAFGGLVGLIPIRDEADFLLLLHMLQCSTSKNADGVYEVKHAQVAKRVGFRFANQHAYVALDDFDAIKKENLIEPNKVFVRDDKADVRLALRMARLPKELRMQALARVQEAGPMTKAFFPQANPVLGAATEQLIDLVSRFGTDLVEGSRELSLGLRIDSANRELAAEIQFTPLAKSRLARSLASWQETASVFGDLNEGSPVSATRIHFRLPEELRRIVAPLAHEALAQMLR
ncbi:MAG: hypothetical protein ACRELF_17665, partial [Gemmataceae bacterium]